MSDVKDIAAISGTSVFFCKTGLCMHGCSMSARMMAAVAFTRQTLRSRWVMQQTPMPKSSQIFCKSGSILTASSTGWQPFAIKDPYCG
eukprot:1879550-Amphidinium_carterae.1